MSKLKKAVQSHNNRLDRIQRRLQESPERLVITLGGETFEFLLCKYGMSIAAAKGPEYDPVPHIFSLVRTVVTGQKLLAELARMHQEGKALPSDASLVSEYVLPALTKATDAKVLDALTVILWAGLLPFDPDIILEEVEVMLTPGVLVREVPRIVQAVMSYADDAAPEEEPDEEEAEPDADDEGGTEGN